MNIRVNYSTCLTGYVINLFSRLVVVAKPFLKEYEKPNGAKP